MIHTVAPRPAQRLRAALADVAVAGDERDLAGDHDVGGALDAVDERLAAAVEVVELRLRDGVIDVDGGERQLAFRGHPVEPLDARRRFLGDAADLGEAGRVPARLRLEPLADRGIERRLFFVRGLRDDGRVLLGLAAEDQEKRRVAAVVEDHVGVLAGRPLEDAMREVPVFLERLALVREDRDARGGNRGGGVILRREDVAGRPAHVGAERGERLDQYRGLDRHVQRARDAGAGERFAAPELGAHRHEARHFGLGDRDLAAAEIGLADVGDLVVLELGVDHGIHGHLSPLRARAPLHFANFEPGRPPPVATLLEVCGDCPLFRAGGKGRTVPS